jgi:hypothetical protein
MMKPIRRKNSSLAVIAERCELGSGAMPIESMPWTATVPIATCVRTFTRWFRLPTLPFWRMANHPTKTLPRYTNGAPKKPCVDSVKRVVSCLGILRDPIRTDMPSHFSVSTGPRTGKRLLSLSRESSTAYIGKSPLKHSMTRFLRNRKNTILLAHHDVSLDLYIPATITSYCPQWREILTSTVREAGDDGYSLIGKHKYLYRVCLQRHK